jgi:hypothetical protein
MEEALDNLYANCLLLEKYKRRITFINSNKAIKSDYDNNEDEINKLETEIKIARLNKYIVEELNENINIIFYEYLSNEYDEQDINLCNNA